MAGKKTPSIFNTLQKTAENASAVNSEFVRQLSVDALDVNPLNRFSMAEDEEFLATLASVEKDGFLEDIIVNIILFCFAQRIIRRTHGFNNRFVIHCHTTCCRQCFDYSYYCSCICSYDI